MWVEPFLMAQATDRVKRKGGASHKHPSLSVF